MRLVKRLKGEGGFTLIELLVVVLIVGILAAIALPTFLENRDEGQSFKIEMPAEMRCPQGVDSVVSSEKPPYTITVTCNK